MLVQLHVKLNWKGKYNQIKAWMQIGLEQPQTLRHCLVITKLSFAIVASEFKKYLLVQYIRSIYQLGIKPQTLLEF